MALNLCRLSARPAVFLLAAALVVSCGSAQPARTADPAPKVIRLWPGQPPGTEAWTGPEEAADADLPNVGKVHVITNVTMPTLTVFRPAPGQVNSTGMLVVPGGAFRALPWDLDGLETARWLTQHGITAFVLKYRVRPPGPGVPPDRSFEDFARRTKAARQVVIADAHQAMRIIRAHSKEFGVAADQIGMIGFSAGAMTTVSVANSNDAAVRPNFAASLYGAYLDETGPSAEAAPLFIVAAQDDPEAPPIKSAELFKRWTEAKRPAELHIYEKGGHGFAFRVHHVPADRWTDAFETWLRQRSLSAPPATARQ